MMLDKKVSPVVGYTIIAIAALAFIGINWYVQSWAQSKVSEIIVNMGNFSVGNLSGAKTAK
ncbi:MAG: hypothetical protein NT026_02585 [Candidatus Staskawiczbacteria bacterium]|nr:hypothetical protein [Candidatus Staskawiczbacteria bacterium]